jgi:hypothetical protein
MTKGRAVLPGEWLLNRSWFSSAWVGQRPMIPPVEMTKGRVVVARRKESGEGKT